MSEFNKFWVLVVVFFSVGLLAVGGGIYAFKVVIDKWTAGHMNGVAQTVKEYGENHSEINSDTEAIRAIEILRYISSYYVVSNGYRGPRESEVALEKQREESMMLIVDALEKYSGEEFGLDIAAWEEWADEVKLKVDK